MADGEWVDSQDDGDDGDTDYEPEHLFMTDDGELDGMSPRDAFTLGVEYWMVVSFLMDDEAGFIRPIHLDNLARLRLVIEGKQKRTLAVKTVTTGEQELWCEITVGPRLSADQ